MLGSATLVVCSAVGASAFWSEVHQGSASVSDGVEVRVAAPVGPGPLGPGGSNELLVTIANPGATPVTVLPALEVQPRAGDPTFPQCPAELVTARLRRAGSLVIPARSQARVVVVVSLSPKAPGSCQGKRLPVRLVLTTV